MIKQRKIIQLIATLIANANLKGFISGQIFRGKTKYFCVPVLNCYSCPAAIFSCPVGAAQNTLANGGTDPQDSVSFLKKLVAFFSGIPLFIIGFLTVVGALSGRAACGWLCPFGLFQEFVHKIPSPKFQLPRFARFGKYIMLVLFVVLLPLIWVDRDNRGEPYFCKYICAAGTLEGGFTLPILNPDLRQELGKLFVWKTSTFVLFCLLMIFFNRPFCAIACPLGAFLSFFNKLSILKLEIEETKCVKCKVCARTCPAGLKPEQEIDSFECVRCFECAKVCPKGAFTITGIKTHIVENNSQSAINV